MEVLCSVFSLFDNDFFSSQCQFQFILILDILIFHVAKAMMLNHCPHAFVCFVYRLCFVHPGVGEGNEASFLQGTRWSRPP